MERRALRELLSRFQQLAKYVAKHKEAHAEICQLMEGVSIEMLDISLPSTPRPSPSRSPIYFTSIYDGPTMECSVFGFFHQNAHLPLHDHPNIHGFIRVLRGKVQVKSYSWLEPDEERKLLNNAMAGGDSMLAQRKPVRFAGNVFNVFRR